MNFIENLREKRLNWIKANRENGFEDGIKNLLTELYPDNAHFIYELLQNAEDAQATKVKFVLNRDGLNFLHNGKKQFSEDDIKSITSIGDSTKIGKDKQIGKFGVGFKSVFSYTNTPRIYTSKYSFEIHDLVCPKSIDQLSQFLNNSNNSTFFWFPFNHKEKAKDKAFSEVKQTLLSLPENTILFLQNIEEINWEISDGKKENGLIKRSDKNQNFFEIEKSSKKSNWLLFRKEIPNKQGLYVAIAFKLVAEKDRFKFESNVEKADVSIFFPAEKEVSNLKFFIHAPFAATVARDSIQNKEENKDLRNLLIELFIESLPKIKELGMLDENFLSILPHNKETLAEFYAPFRSRIIEIFQNQPFTPVSESKFLPASKLLQATKEIKSVVKNDTILSYIIDSEVINNNFEWVITVGRGSRAYSFLESLNIREVTFKEILDKTAFTFSSEKNAEEFLPKLSDEWMQSFYALLGKGIETHKEHFESYPYLKHKIKDANIVRLQNGKHVKGQESFFQTDFVKQAEDVNLVRQEIYQFGDNQNQKEISEKFLIKIGVKNFSEEDEIEHILEKHYLRESFKIKETENLEHLKKFVRYWKETEDANIFFGDYLFLRIEETESENGMYSSPSNIYLDEPFEKTGFSKVAEIQNKYELWNAYKDKIKGKEFMPFLKAIGIVCNLEIEKCSVYDNPSNLSSGFWNSRVTDSMVDVDYNIESLEKLLEKQDREISLLVWNTMKDLENSWHTNYFQARYSPNQSTTQKRGPSQLIHYLKSYAWIPDVNGNFYEPNQITREMLPKDFVPDNQNGWLDEIGMKSQTEIDNQKKTHEKVERERKEKAAEELGVNLGEIEQYKKEKAEFEEYKREKKAKAERTSKRKQIPVPNQSQNFNDYSFDDTDSNFKDRDRTVTKNRTSKVEEYADTKIDARGFLKSQYTNEFDILICQICQEEMPFQTYDGEWYFIATKIIEKTTKDNVANYLCCCPNCSEMYKQANPNQDEMISIITESDSDNCMLTLELAGNEIDIEFKEKHFEELFNFADRQNY